MVTITDRWRGGFVNSIGSSEWDLAWKVALVLLNGLAYDVCFKIR